MQTALADDSMLLELGKCLRSARLLSTGCDGMRVGVSLSVLVDLTQQHHHMMINVLIQAYKNAMWSGLWPCGAASAAGDVSFARCCCRRSSEMASASTAVCDACELYVRRDVIIYEHVLTTPVAQSMILASSR